MNFDEVFDYGNMVILDLETSGLSPCVDMPIEVGLLFVIDWIPSSPISWFINPNYPEKFNIPEEIKALTGITAEQIAVGADPKVFYPALASLLQGMRIWGHNVSMFDKKFLDCELGRTCIVPFKEEQYFDTAAIAPRKGVYYNLPFSCTEYGVDTSNLTWHKAGHDVTATFRLLKAMRGRWLAGEL
jgi:DNA polymerase III epsilon subunit-like protein